MNNITYQVIATSARVYGILGKSMRLNLNDSFWGGYFEVLFISLDSQINGSLLENIAQGIKANEKHSN